MDRFSKGTGIVCEYNPFHNGHAYQIEKLKESGAEFVVCAMSGGFVQRGEPAFQDKKTRAENAVNNGADIVLEIPFPFSSLGAEGFARAGISILENCGLCSSFAFGSECADVELLSAVADLLGGDFYCRTVELQKKEPSLSFASAREKLIEKELGRRHADVVTRPNDILAVEYLKANKTLLPVAIKRETPRGGFDKDFASSSYIRKNIFDKENGPFARANMPENCRLDGIVRDFSPFYNYLHISLMQKNPQDLYDIAEVGSGSEYSISKNVLKANDYGELCRLLSSKTLTDAKVRRMLLFSLFGVKKSMAKETPLYTQVLAASETGRKKLKQYADDRKIIVASRVADIKQSSEAFAQYNFARRAEEVLEKCLSNLQSC